MNSSFKSQETGTALRDFVSSFCGNRIPSTVLCMYWVLRSQWFPLDMNIQNSSAWFLSKKDELCHILIFYANACSNTILPVREGLKITLD